jgi:hypothetical protein
VATIRHLARWIAWQIGEHEKPTDQPPAHITVFLGDGAVEEF